MLFMKEVEILIEGFIAKYKELTMEKSLEEIFRKKISEQMKNTFHHNHRGLQNKFCLLQRCENLLEES